MALFPAVYTGLVVVSPLLRAAGHPRAGLFVFSLFHGLCHQFPWRTIFVEGYPMAVCARCFALAASLAAGAVLAGRVAAFEATARRTRASDSPAASPARRLRLSFAGMCAAAVPMAIDGFTQLFGLRESTNTLRVITGCLLGLAVAFWVVPHLYDAFDEQRRNYFHV